MQARGDGISEIRPGDVITTPSGEWHWHGAAPDDGRPEMDWGEQP